MGVGSSRVISRLTILAHGFHAKYVSALKPVTIIGLFEKNPGDDATDPPGLDSPYLIIQRQFETPDGGRCYVETHDHVYVGTTASS